MTQDVFFLLGMALLGAYAVGWTRRLAPAWSELPLKTLLATGAAAAVVAASFVGGLPGAYEYGYEVTYWGERLSGDALDKHGEGWRQHLATLVAVAAASAVEGP